MMFGNTVWEAAVQRLVPEESLLGLAIWGPVAELVGTTGALWISGGISLATAVLLLSVREVRAVR